MGFKDYINHAVGGRESIGETLRAKRVAQGLSLFTLAHELNLSVSIIEAVEAEAWHRLPKGRERPHTRLIAERLGVDLDLFLDQWEQLPGAVEQEPSEPHREILEKALVSAIMVCSIILLIWLVMPGPNLKHPVHVASAGKDIDLTVPPSWTSSDGGTGLYPVSGESLPEVPVNSDGVIVSMRAIDTCEATIRQYKNIGNPIVQSEQKRTLLVSEPWRLRVKGPFTISLDNAGVVAVEVAGRCIRNRCTVGESWSGNFGANGKWILPIDNQPKGNTTHTVPEADQEATEPE